MNKITTSFSNKIYKSQLPVTKYLTFSVVDCINLSYDVSHNDIS